MLLEEKVTIGMEVPIDSHKFGKNVSTEDMLVRI